MRRRRSVHELRPIDARQFAAFYQLLLFELRNAAPPPARHAEHAHAAGIDELQREGAGGGGPPVLRPANALGKATQARLTLDGVMVHHDMVHSGVCTSLGSLPRPMLEACAQQHGAAN